MLSTTSKRLMTFTIGFSIPFSSYQIYKYIKFRRENQNILSNSNHMHRPSLSQADNDHKTPEIDQELHVQPSFQTILLYKLMNFEFNEITKSTVLIELLLICTPALFAGAISYYTYFNHYLKFKQRNFFNSINVTLNTVSKGDRRFKGKKVNFVLRHRTIMDKDINVIIPNRKGVEVLQTAASKATQERPFIDIDDHNHRQSIRSLVRDHISSLCEGAYIYDDLQCTDIDTHNMWSGRAKKSQISHALQRKYLVAYTTWPFGNKANRKIRIMLIKKSALSYLIENLGLDRENWRSSYSDIYDDRWWLLYEMAKEWKANGHIEHNENRFISTVELAAIDYHSMGMNPIYTDIRNDIEGGMDVDKIRDELPEEFGEIRKSDREFLKEINKKLNKFMEDTAQNELNLGVMKGRRKELLVKSIDANKSLELLTDEEGKEGMENAKIELGTDDKWPDGKPKVWMKHMKRQRKNQIRVKKLDKGTKLLSKSVMVDK